MLIHSQNSDVGKQARVPRGNTADCAEIAQDAICVGASLVGALNRAGTMPPHTEMGRGVKTWRLRPSLCIWVAMTVNHTPRSLRPLR